MIGMAVMNRFQCEVLILTSNTTSVRQWVEELKRKTDIPADSIGNIVVRKRGASDYGGNLPNIDTPSHQRWGF